MLHGRETRRRRITLTPDVLSQSPRMAGSRPSCWCKPPVSSLLSTAKHFTFPLLRLTPRLWLGVGQQTKRGLVRDVMNIVAGPRRRRTDGGQLQRKGMEGERGDAARG